MRLARAVGLVWARMGQGFLHGRKEDRKAELSNCRRGKDAVSCIFVFDFLDCSCKHACVLACVCTRGGWVGGCVGGGWLAGWPATGWVGWGGWVGMWVDGLVGGSIVFLRLGKRIFAGECFLVCFGTCLTLLGYSRRVMIHCRKFDPDRVACWTLVLESSD